MNTPLPCPREAAGVSERSERSSKLSARKAHAAGERSEAAA
ncbi:hypothetical protein [Micromonospora sp. NPDC004704]